MERVDRLVQRIGDRHGVRSDALDEIVARLDAHLAVDRRMAA